MKKSLSLLILFTALSIAAFSASLKIHPVQAVYVGTVYIRSDGTVEPSDAPIENVGNVTYSLTGYINGSIIIERDNITLDGKGNLLQLNDTGIGIDISHRKNVTVTNIRVEHFYTGIRLTSSSNNTIRDSTLSENTNAGIRLINSDNNTLTCNEAYNCGGYAILLESSHNNTISVNTVSQTGYGIWLDCSSDNTITGNNASSNTNVGIAIMGAFTVSFSSNNNVSQNTAVDNTYGIQCLAMMGSCDHNYFCNNNASNNHDYGMWIEGDNHTIIGNTASHNDYGIKLMSSNSTLARNTVSNNKHDGITVVNSRRNNITHNTANSNLRSGIVLENSHNNTIANNRALSNEGNVGIQVLNSNNNNFTENNASENLHGFWLQNSHNNALHNNIASSNTQKGIAIYSSINNTAWANTISSNNESGIWLCNATNNKIYHNNIINNTRQVYDFAWDHPPWQNSTNTWDDEYPSGGNYWDDYNGTDTNEDAIGETPYTIDSNNQDRYPLTAPFHDGLIRYQEKTYYIMAVSNSTLQDFQLNATSHEFKFNVTGPEGTLGIFRAAIPNKLVDTLWNGNYTVLINKTPQTFKNWTAGDYTYIYLTYYHPDKEITIIPELPLTNILPLLMAITITLIIHKTLTKHQIKS